MKSNFFKNGGVVTAIALAGLFAACSNNEKKAETTSPSSATSISAEDKIVFVNSDTLLAKYEYFKDLRSKMESKGKAAESDLASKEQAFRREVQQYQQAQNSMSADERATTEQRLARKQQELQVYQQNAGAALQTEQAKEQEILYDKVADYLKEYAKSKGYKMVLTYSKGNSAILFADDALDVTKPVIEGLNAGYKKTNK
ncbi:MAG: OmpH family outer membrane protein [Pedobacter sp.]|nr:MAG: OmpH family outer membrane protein [Pedobacter sp.]